MPKRTWRMADGIPLTADEIIEQCDPAKVMKDYRLLNATSLKSFLLIMRYNGLCAEAERRARECLRRVLTENLRRNAEAISSSMVDKLASCHESAICFLENGELFCDPAERVQPSRGKKK